MTYPSDSQVHEGHPGRQEHHEHRGHHGHQEHHGPPQSGEHPTHDGQPGVPPWGTPQVTYVHPPPGRFSRFMLRMWERSPTWLAPAAILVCFAGAVGYVLAREPIDGAGDESTCLVKLTTGFACPGCGGTRAFFYLVQGDMPAAARHHLIFVFAVPFLLYAYFAWAGNKVFRWRLPQLRPSPWMIGAFLSAAGVFTVLRNLPFSPFTWFYV